MVGTSSAEWAENMKEEQVVHHPSDKANRRRSGDGLEDFEPHEVDHDVIEEGDEGPESPRKQSRQSSEETSGMKKSTSSCWDEVDELVDVSVAEERLRRSLDEQGPYEEGSS